MQNSFQIKSLTHLRPFLMQPWALHSVSTQSVFFFPPLTSWCITQKDAGGSLLLWGENIATHFSCHFSHALPAATAPAGFFFLGFSVWVFLVGLSSVLNFTIQKCYLTQVLRKSCLPPQTDNWHWWRGAVLPQLPKFKPKKNSDRRIKTK